MGWSHTPRDGRLADLSSLWPSRHGDILCAAGSAIPSDRPNFRSRLSVSTGHVAAIVDFIVDATEYKLARSSWTTPRARPRSKASGHLAAELIDTNTFSQRPPFPTTENSTRPIRSRLSHGRENADRTYMLRILLVDDDQDILVFAKALLLSPRPALAGASVDVVTFDNPVAALDRAREQEFDLIITDANMKPHSGFELVRLLRQLPTTATTPIAMLTGRRERRDVERAVHLGAQAYLVKPLDPAAFLGKVDELLEKRLQSKRTARFAVVHLDEPANGECYFRLKALTETGGIFEADIRPRKGLKVNLKSPILEQIGFMHLPIEVIDSQEKDGGWEVRFAYQTMEARQLQRLRAFIAAKTASSTAAPHRRGA